MNAIHSNATAFDFSKVALGLHGVFCSNATAKQAASISLQAAMEELSKAMKKASKIKTVKAFKERREHLVSTLEVAKVVFKENYLSMTKEVRSDVKKQLDTAETFLSDSFSDEAKKELKKSIEAKTKEFTDVLQSGNSGSFYGRRPVDLSSVFDKKADNGQEDQDTDLVTTEITGPFELVYFKKMYDARKQAVDNLAAMIKDGVPFTLENITEAVGGYSQNLQKELEGLDLYEVAALTLLDGAVKVSMIRETEGNQGIVTHLLNELEQGRDIFIADQVRALQVNATSTPGETEVARTANKAAKPAGKNSAKPAGK